MIAIAVTDFLVTDRMYNCKQREKGGEKEMKDNLSLHKNQLF